VVPLFLSRILPTGTVGFFAISMVLAFISTYDSYMLTFAGILVQDVILPLRNKPIRPKQHIWLLRGAIMFVAVFVFLFSISFDPKQYLWMFFMMSGALYGAGAGAVILGALYFKRGTTSGAWAAMIIGFVVAAGGIVAIQMWDDSFPLDGIRVAFIANLSSIIVYVLVSVCTRNQKFNLDKLLHRTDSHKKTLRNELQETEGFIFRNLNRILVIFLVIALIATGTTVWYNYNHEVNAETWIAFWKCYSFVLFFWSIPVTIWILCGGFRDLCRLLRHLRTEVVDEEDDGIVRD